MHQKIAILEYEPFMDAFIPTIQRETQATPTDSFELKPSTNENQIHSVIPEVLNKGACPGYTFIATPHQGNRSAVSLLAPDLGMYPNDSVPDLREKEDANGTTRTVGNPDWSAVEIVIECKSRTSYDPFSNKRNSNGEPDPEHGKDSLGQLLSYAELVFRHQHRTHQFMVVFFGTCARIVRVDRSGIYATKRIQYLEDQTKLQDFFMRYSRMTPEDRGHDTTVTRIGPTTKLAAAVKLKLEQSSKGSHATQYLRDSLEGKPLWKVKVADELTGTTRYFVVGEPHFAAPGMRGRGTRGYVAIAVMEDGHTLGDEGYLKEAWRVVHQDILKEGNTLKALNDANVRYVPTLLCHGDVVGQKTIAPEKWNPLVGNCTSSLKTHQHYRMVVKEVGKSLSQFTDSHELVLAIYHVIIAHEEAFNAGYIHRDISSGNILLCQDEHGDWCGMLTDWELSKAINSDLNPRQTERTGTWAFLSAHILNNPSKVVVIPDELESIMHVLIYYAVRFLQHNLGREHVGHFLNDYFHGHTEHKEGDRCGRAKQEAMLTGQIDISLYNGDTNPDLTKLRFIWPSAPIENEGFDAPLPQADAAPDYGHPLNNLVDHIFSWLKAHYAADRITQPPTARPRRVRQTKKFVLNTALKTSGTSTNVSDALPVAGPVGEHMDEDLRRSLAEKLTSHTAIEAAFERLFLYLPEGPGNDKTDDKKPQDVSGPDPDPQTSNGGSSQHDVSGSRAGASTLDGSEDDASDSEDSDENEDKDSLSDTAVTDDEGNAASSIFAVTSTRAGSPFLSLWGSSKRKRAGDHPEPTTPTTKRSKY